MGGRAVACRRLALRSTLASLEVVLPVGHIDTHSIRWSLVWSQTPFLALVSCPLSLWERVRVRVFIRTPWGPSPPALSRWEREREASPAMPKEVT